MKTILFISLFIISLYPSAQLIEIHHPTAVKVDTDTIKVKYSNWNETIKLPTLRAFDALKYNLPPQINVNTGSALNGDYAVVYTGKDSVKIVHTNAPYAQLYYINLESPKGHIRFRLGFLSSPALFSSEYIKENKGNAQFEIPEVYELANIIWNLSSSGQRDTSLVKSGKYYKKVFNYFKPYLSHPIFTYLDFPDSTYYKNYYEFRENSFAYSFNGDKIVNDGPYYYVFGSDWDNFTSLFKTLLPLVEDFAKKSKYKKFYKENFVVYKKMIDRQKKMMPITNMWKWLENQFPDNKYDSYRIVFSPLITGTHSTQKYIFGRDSVLFGETVMFVCGPDRYDDRNDLSEIQKSGLLSGVVFTEIDHNYVNPVSDKYAKQIDSVFSDTKNWVSPGASANWYKSSRSVFNEYMTHAVFCLWVLDNYDEATANLIINYRETMMVDRRLFKKFKEFNRALIQIRNENKQLKVVEIYPHILNWCKSQI